MEMTNTQWAATCTRTSGRIGAHVSGSFGPSAAAMPTAPLAGIVRKPATVDARYEAQGARPAWSPPV